MSRLRAAYALIHTLQAGTELADAATRYLEAMPKPCTPAQGEALDALQAAAIAWLNAMEVAQPVLAAQHELQQTLVMGGRPPA